jgi:hypothetical protein
VGVFKVQGLCAPVHGALGGPIEKDDSDLAPLDAEGFEIEAAAVTGVEVRHECDVHRFEIRADEGRAQASSPLLERTTIADAILEWVFRQRGANRLVAHPTITPLTLWYFASRWPESRSAPFADGRRDSKIPIEPPG